ncbi:MAG TPA: isochorismatase family cysteine hydrolase [Bacillales bacterium]|nr:isochorismatase family cysteine hydrolase [Bacillales bacterium]
MSAHTALLIIDVINDLEFDHGESLLQNAQPIVKPINHLRKEAAHHQIPVIYVNDNFGQWQSNKEHIIEKCSTGRGRPIVERLRPTEDDYFVVKPKHSGFFSTPLSTLLSQLQATTLILTGMAGNICVLFTANDAYMRGYDLHIPSDCVASNAEEDNQYALRLMKNTLKADITPSGELDWQRIARKPPKDIIYSAD